MADRKKVVKDDPEMGFIEDRELKDEPAELHKKLPAEKVARNDRAPQRVGIEYGITVETHYPGEGARVYRKKPGK